MVVISKGRGKKTKQNIKTNVPRSLSYIVVFIVVDGVSFNIISRGGSDVRVLTTIILRVRRVAWVGGRGGWGLPKRAKPQKSNNVSTGFHLGIRGRTYNSITVSR